MTSPHDQGLDVALELDCREMPCPMPVIELARHLGDVEVGELLAVVARDPAAAVDVPAWCRMKSQDYVGADTADDGAPRYVIRRLT
ncbi:TusA-related sulfurtransferase [Nocardioides cavernae]|nr:sulfurtransferase TusA family protein [Nocardioides cavernae]MBM7512685.1 TusA-related sulfurtransferase [Nocardioides cavernae]